ncbi:MAG TPA: hypothetical protein VJK50_01705 [Patescibacteria group bacterium]|nr:hypothetical protein [Patescibacteria group bacterium]
MRKFFILRGKAATNCWKKIEMFVRSGNLLSASTPTVGEESRTAWRDESEGDAHA